MKTLKLFIQINDSLMTDYLLLRILCTVLNKIDSANRGTMYKNFRKNIQKSNI